MPGKILVVDDEVHLALLIEYTLKSRGFAVQSIHKATEALELIDSGTDIQLVITDLHMPEISGFDLFMELGRRGKRIPVLLVTAAGEEEITDQALKMGVAGVLNKPFARKQLLEQVEQLVE